MQQFCFFCRDSIPCLRERGREELREQKLVQYQEQYPGRYSCKHHHLRYYHHHIAHLFRLLHFHRRHHFLIRVDRYGYTHHQRLYYHHHIVRLILLYHCHNLQKQRQSSNKHLIDHWRHQDNMRPDRRQNHRTYNLESLIPVHR